jgi:hypothetical protein
MYTKHQTPAMTFKEGMAWYSSRAMPSLSSVPFNDADVHTSIHNALKTVHIHLKPFIYITSIPFCDAGMHIAKYSAI